MRADISVRQVATGAFEASFYGGPGIGRVLNYRPSEQAARQAARDDAKLCAMFAGREREERDDE